MKGSIPNHYYRWSKDFLEAGKKRLNSDIQREANTDEVSDLRQENAQLKEVVADLLLKNRKLKKNANAWEAEQGELCARIRQRNRRSSVW